MNILLWVLQVLLAFFCVAGGSYKITNFALLQGSMASMRALPQALWMFFGAFEVVAGLGLGLPGVIKRMRFLVTYVAVALATESIVISALYLYYGDRAPVPYTLTGAVLATFIAYGRFELKPL